MKHLDSIWDNLMRNMLVKNLNENNVFKAQQEIINAINNKNDGHFENRLAGIMQKHDN